MIEQYLEDLENRIDPDVEEKLLSEWRAFLDGELGGGVFSPRRQKAAPAAMEWPEVSVNAALDDFDLMALQQLSACSVALADGDGSVLNVRANYGTGIVPSVFGAEMFVMSEHTNTLPTTRPLDGEAAAVRRLLDAGAPDLHTGYGERCFAMGRRFVELFADYPNVSRYVRIYHPDLQGPMDVCELLWGSDIFIALIDTPELAGSLLQLIVDTYIRFMHEWEQIAPPQADYSPHWGMMHKGRIMIRDDSGMNLSPDMFDEFIRPYDQQLLSEFGGGGIHFCGRGDHYIDRLHEMTGVYAVNMSQPECNDMECIFRNTVDKGIALVGLEPGAAESALTEGRDLHGLAHCL